MSDSSTVVILGGGIGGVVAARKIRSSVPGGTRVVVVERQPMQSFPPSYTWVMTSERKPASISRDLRRLHRKGIEVIDAGADSIDFERRVVLAGGREITYDYLVVALGAELAPENVPGLAGEAFSYYRLADAERLHKELQAFEGGRIALLIPSLPYKCPAAPYEGAMLLDALFRKRGNRNRVEISLSTPEPQPLPVAGPMLGTAVVSMLERKQIAYHPKRKPTTIDAAAHEVVFDDGAREKYDLLIALPPHRPPAIVRESPIAGPTGWAKVDPALLLTECPRVFAIGDATAIPLFDGMMLPKAGVFAHAEAEVVAHNIAAEMRGDAERSRFDGHGYCFLEVGDGKAASADGNFYAEPRHVDMKDPTRCESLERWRSNVGGCGGGTDVRLTAAQYESLIEFARAALPHEACGLLAGKGDAVLDVFPLTNIERNPVGCGWRADSREQFRAFERIDEEGWELLAIYHSHPRSDARPSERDVEHALYPDARYVIVSLVDPAFPVAASFRIVDGQARQEPPAIVGRVEAASPARTPRAAAP